MNNIKVFNYEGMHEVRTIIVEEDVWFVAKDVCDVLDLTNHKVYVSRLDDDEKLGVTISDPHGRPQITNAINESGLYSLIFRSRKPEARQFKRWITHEVIPSIRKHGTYMTPDTLEQAIMNPDFMIGLLTNLKAEKDERQRLEAKIVEDAPKISYYEIVLQSTNAVNITQIAEDYGLSAKVLNEILSNERVQRRVGGQWVLYQKYKKEGYTKSKTIAIGNGNSKIHTQWTQKGRLFIHELLAQRGIHPVCDDVA